MQILALAAPWVDQGAHARVIYRRSLDEGNVEQNVSSAATSPSGGDLHNKTNH
jgi:hypothetical protein